MNVEKIADLRKRITEIETALLFGGYPTLKAQRNAVALVRALRADIEELEKVTEGN